MPVQQGLCTIAPLTEDCQWLCDTCATTHGGIFYNSQLGYCKGHEVEGHKMNHVGGCHVAPPTAELGTFERPGIPPLS
jgi:hypothetical protein